VKLHERQVTAVAVTYQCDETDCGRRVSVLQHLGGPERVPKNWSRLPGRAEKLRCANCTYAHRPGGMVSELPPLPPLPKGALPPPKTGGGDGSSDN
jgi:hypothetical protein